MATVHTYLIFKGNCEEAFNFYKSVFGGDFIFLGRYSEMPTNDGCEVSDADKNKIMHISLPIGHTILMGSDWSGDWASTLVAGNNFSISINAESKDEADRLFNGISADGKITMPMENAFWGAYFGMATDKFGINWMVNFDEKIQG